MFIAIERIFFEINVSYRISNKFEAKGYGYKKRANCDLIMAVNH